MTLEQIEQRLEALQAQNDKLIAELERLIAEQANVALWRATEDGRYYAIDADNAILELDEDLGKDCDGMFSCGNYYRTRELAEQDAKELALRGRVRQLRDAICEGYQFVPYELNYCVAFSHTNDKFCVLPSETINDIGVIYFDTKDHAQQACDILNAELIKEE